MSRDQRSVPVSLMRKFAVVLQPLKTPGTATEVAFGAQTRKVTPVPSKSAYGIAPMPGRADCARQVIAETSPNTAATIAPRQKCDLPARTKRLERVERETV